jgi:hypothetical protein
LKRPKVGWKKNCDPLIPIGWLCARLGKKYFEIKPLSFHCVIVLLCSFQDLQGFGRKLLIGGSKLLILRDIGSQHDGVFLISL